MSGTEEWVRLEQLEEFRFRVRFDGHPYGPIIVDEEAPVGGDTGPGPSRLLAAAVGHCLSSTLYNCLKRARVATRPMATRARPEVGRNDQGRLRVQRLVVEIRVAPEHEEDRERFEHCLAVFEEYCTVSAAIRPAIPIDLKVLPPEAARPTDRPAPPWA